MGAVHGHRYNPKGTQTPHIFLEALGSKITSSVKPFMISSNISATCLGLPDYFLHRSILVLNSIILQMIATWEKFCWELGENNNKVRHRILSSRFLESVSVHVNEMSSPIFVLCVRSLRESGCPGSKLCSQKEYLQLSVPQFSNLWNRHITITTQGRQESVN